MQKLYLRLQRYALNDPWKTFLYSRAHVTESAKIVGKRIGSGVYELMIEDLDRGL